MARIQGLTDTDLLNAGQQIKSVEGYVFSLTIGWVGCAIGDRFEFKDYDGSTGSPHRKVTIYFPTVTGTLTKSWINGKKFDHGILSTISSVAGGTVEYELTYK